MFSCDDGFGEDAAWLGAWCGLGAGWEDVWAVSYFSGVQCIPADSYLPTPLYFPISYFYFLLEFTQMLTCKLLNSSKSQSEILSYQIINNCRMYYSLYIRDYFYLHILILRRLLYTYTTLWNIITVAHNK